MEVGGLLLFKYRYLSAFPVSKMPQIIWNAAFKLIEFNLKSFCAVLSGVVKDCT